MIDIINQIRSFSFDYEFENIGRIQYKRNSWEQLWYLKILEGLFPNDFKFDPGGCKYV